MALTVSASVPDSDGVRVADNVPCVASESASEGSRIGAKKDSIGGPCLHRTPLRNPNKGAAGRGREDEGASFFTNGMRSVFIEAPRG